MLEGRAGGGGRGRGRHHVNGRVLVVVGGSGVVERWSRSGEEEGTGMNGRETGKDGRMLIKRGREQGTGKAREEVETRLCDNNTKRI